MTRRLFMTTDAAGGVWRYSTMLAARLAAGGLAVRLGVVGDPPSHDQEAEVSAIGGVDVVTLHVPYDWLAGNREAVVRARRRVATAAADWEADLVQLNQPAYAIRGARTPVLAVVHSCVETWWRGTRRQPAPGAWRWHGEAVREGLLAADAAVAPTAAFARMVRETYRLPKPLHVVHNGAPDCASIAPKRCFLLAAGRAWDESKNFAVLDRAAPAIAWPIRLAGACVAPDFSGAAHLPSLLCLGQLDPPSMAGEYAAAPIFVSPSLHEPFGLAVLEAAQAGAALLLSDIAPFRELWPDAALFFEPHDPAALAAQANRLIADSVLRARLAEAARRRARRFAIERTTARMTRLYRSLMEHRSGAEGLA